MKRQFKPSRARLEFEAVKGLARDSFNDYFLLMASMALLSLLVLMTLISGEFITLATATLVVLSGLFFALWVLGEFKMVYPQRFKILYKRK